MYLSILFLIVGCGFLAWSADRFVLGASAIAKNLGVPSLMIGIVLVGFATSFPEILVSSIAAWHGNAELALGNAIGSYITNIGLVLGVTALVAPLAVHSNLLKREFPILVLALGLAWLLLLDGNLSRLDGALLLSAFVVAVGLVGILAWRNRKSEDAIVEEFRENTQTELSNSKALFWLVLGFVVLFASSRLLVFSAVNIAKAFGVSDLMIGLTIVAVGTSLPELAASIASALKNEPDIALGNVIGSNMLGILAVTAMPGLFSPGHISHEILQRDFPVMGGLTLVLFLMSYGFRGRPQSIVRWEGALLLASFVGYLVLLYYWH